MVVMIIIIVIMLMMMFMKATPMVVLTCGDNGGNGNDDGDGNGDVGDGNVDDGDQAIIDIGDITIPVTIIPSNNSTIANPSPDTIIEVIIPEISVVPIGTPLPSNIPLNSLTPDIFEVVPTTLDLTDISNPGNLANISCF